MNYNIFNEQNNLPIHLKDIIFRQQQFIDKQNLEIKKLKDENKKLKNQKNNQQLQKQHYETIIDESLLEQVFNKCLEKNLQSLNLTSFSNHTSTDVHNIDSCLKPSNMKSSNYTNSNDININNYNKDNEIELTKQSSMNLNLVMNE